jgi:anti-sigma factor RsiW
VDLCREAAELVSAYLDDALDPALRRAVRAHLEDCPDCAAFRAKLKQTIALLNTLEGGPVEPALRESLLQAFRVGAPPRR